MSKSEPMPYRSVLVVEDSAVQRQHVVRLCKELGFTSIHQAADGVEALELLATLPATPDLLLVDLEMPRMDGVELIQELHRHGSGVPIVLVSSRDPALLESLQAMGGGVIAGTGKPLTRTALQAALDRRTPTAAPTPVPERRKGNRLSFTREMLATAIVDRRIVPYFQPKVDLRTGILRGVESLARWKHDDLGWIPPDQFVAVAEREGLIHALTLSIMDQSFAQAGHWSDRGLRLSVAVNLSPKVLEQPGLVGEIEALSARYGLAPAQIVLEVTEGSIVGASGSAPAALARLRLKGFGLSIDDYGTGFSSLQQLGRIPFTEVKIDRSFVDGAHARKNLRVILQSAILLAQQLDLATVAEGVETIEDWRLLQHCGCLSAQGWLVAKAMPGPELRGWIRTGLGRLSELRSVVKPVGHIPTPPVTRILETVPSAS